MSVGSDYFKKRIREIDTAEKPHDDVVDIIEFTTSPSFLHLSLFPWQSVCLKLYYKVVDKYPFTEEEKAFIVYVKARWRVDLMKYVNATIPFRILVLVIGRRSGKTSLVALVLCYEAYKLIKKGNPQKYYGIIEDDEICLMNCASNERQAKQVFRRAKAFLKNCAFFNDYLDFDKDSETELRLFTPRDALHNRRIQERNALRKRGEQRENYVRGTILLWCISTTARGSRGVTALLIIFDEFAHFLRAKIKSGKTKQIEAGSNQTDVEVYRALTPSVKTFGKDGKIIALSTPREKGGRCYSLYQESFESLSVLAIQAETWRANPHIAEEDLQEEKKEDPRGYRSEYGAEFLDPAGSFLPTEKLSKLPIKDKPILLTGRIEHKYIITLDPAKGSDPTSDTYAVGWGHAEIDQDTYHYYVDGLHGFEPTIQDQGGFLNAIPVNPLVVDQFILDLVSRLRNVVLIAYDQYNSASSIAKFQQLHLPALETTFTNAYKAKMYGAFFQKLNLETVHFYGIEQNTEYHWIDTCLLELAYLQEIVSGNSVTYKHPDSGPVTTDDFADVSANLVYLLEQYAIQGVDFYKKLLQAGVRPQPKSTTLSPVTGSSLPGYGGLKPVAGSSRGGGPPTTAAGLRDRRFRR